MTETNKNTGEKLSVTSTKTLTLKRGGVEQGVVRQSFSHGRSKAVVVEKVKRRTASPGVAESQSDIPIIRAFTSSQLDLAWGRPHVIHAALLSGREGESFLARWRTLERYRMNVGRGAPRRADHEAVQPHAARKLGTE